MTQLHRAERSARRWGVQNPPPWTLRHRLGRWWCWLTEHDHRWLYGRRYCTRCMPTPEKPRPLVTAANHVAAREIVDKLLADRVDLLSYAECYPVEVCMDEIEWRIVFCDAAEFDEKVAYIRETVEAYERIARVA